MLGSARSQKKLLVQSSEGLSVGREELGSNPVVDSTHVLPTHSLTCLPISTQESLHFPSLRCFLLGAKVLSPHLPPPHQLFSFPLPFPHLSPSPASSRVWASAHPTTPSSNLECGGGTRRGTCRRKLQARPVQTRVAASSLPLEASQESCLSPATYPAWAGGRRDGLQGGCCPQRGVERGMEQRRRERTSSGRWREAERMNH